MNRKITEDDLKIMHLIEQNPSMSQREIAKKSGSSLGKINYIISALIDIGFIKVKNFTNSNKKVNYLYLLTPKGIAKKTIITKNFISKKKEEYDLLVSYLDKN